MLDIATERGQETVVQEERAVEIITGQWPGCVYAHTPKDRVADIDAIITRDGVVSAIAETKCRNMTLNDLRTTFKNEWLVTYQKLVKGEKIALALQVGFWGFLYLVPDDVVLRVKLFSPDHGWLVPFRVEKTITQRSVNGGEALRDNAYIDMEAADVLVRKPSRWHAGCLA